MAEQITNYKCPACTGPLHFQGSTGKMECEYCGSTYEVAEIEKLYDAADEKAIQAKAQADSAAAAQEADEWSMGTEQMAPAGMKSYNCPSCGAELICEETMAASNCPYCGNPAIVPGQFTGMLQPDYVIPFKYDKKHALEALKKHYGNRFLLPKTFKDDNHLEKVQGVYVPFWLYDGETEGDTVYEAYKSHTKRTGNTEITTKEIYHVERSGGLAFEKIPADASTRMDDALMDSIEPYNYKEMKPFSKAYLTGYLADKYDVTAEENAERALKRAKESTKDKLREDVKGYDSVSEKRESVHVEQGKVSYAMIPVWLLNTKWNNQDFMFAMNGQTGKMVGDLPVDTAKLAITTAATALIAFLLGNFLLNFSVGVAIFAALCIAGIVAAVLYGGMKSVVKASTANEYILENSVKITHRVDRFVRREETRRTIETKKD